MVGSLGIWLEFCADLKIMDFLYCLLCLDVSVSRIFWKNASHYSCQAGPGEWAGQPWLWLWCPSHAELHLSFVNPSLEWAEAQDKNKCVEKLIVEDVQSRYIFSGAYFPVSLCSFFSRHQQKLVVALQRCSLISILFRYLNMFNLCLEQEYISGAMLANLKD